MLLSKSAAGLTVYCCTATALVDIASACVHAPEKLAMAIFPKKSCCRSFHATSDMLIACMCKHLQQPVPCLIADKLLWPRLSAVHPQIFVWQRSYTSDAICALVSFLSLDQVCVMDRC